MDDLMTQLYYFLDDFLPVVHYPTDAQDALEATLTPEQKVLFEHYQTEVFNRDDAERRLLFNYLVKLGLYIP